MKNSKQPALCIRSKVIVVFEKKKTNRDQGNQNDTTTGTITLTGTGIVFNAGKAN